MHDDFSALSLIRIVPLDIVRGIYGDEGLKWLARIFRWAVKGKSDLWVSFLEAFRLTVEYFIAKIRAIQSLYFLFCLFWIFIKALDSDHISFIFLWRLLILECLIILLNIIIRFLNLLVVLLSIYLHLILILFLFNILFLWLII